ncbi:hypothetical protein JM18_000307 [Phytophthora kernoviae]|uniref:CBS domain-containing protein n=2 Tax=Phytophthora kernoviae TaxID=325452 RepID=A0A8T0MCE4_9STRA|nr:hypothetical protein G195_004037 [Phytophthora kernoviae 00238/432]KAG2532454.1 hypothetical protein JM16_000390 [Phytophthora kernoviae]KAG2533473.1 hypothetical protein JM18_000307 [Phytophthora kernoviae]
MQRKERDARKPRELVFSTRKAGRLAKARQQQQQQHQDSPSAEGSKPVKPHELQRETSHNAADSMTSSRQHRSTRSHSRSVKRMRPSRALLQGDHATVAHCVKTMVDKKTDAVLLVDKSGLLTGILTDRDVALKVVAVGRDPKTTRVNEVMTPDPSCVSASASAIDALKMMISGQFRHLPVTDNGKVVGILDIAKCLYEAIMKLEHAYRKSSEGLEDMLNKLQEEMAGSARENLFENLRRQEEVEDEGSNVGTDDPDSEGVDVATLVMLAEDSDLKDAVTRARTWGNKYIRLMVPHYRIPGRRERLAVRRALAHNNDTALGMVYYAAAVAAIAGASFFLSRRK